MNCRNLFLSCILMACGRPDVAPEPLDLPADPAATGVPVGVVTESWGSRTVEIWYPASDETSGDPESLDYADIIPASVEERLGTVTVPLVPTLAIRDAPLRVPVTPYPVIVFSHGFGGNRTQSVDLTTHLASRGYVVLATDHIGRSLGDLLPCLFEPPADGCNLAFDDPGVADVDALVDELEGLKGWLADAVDPALLGLFGHSAGGGTTTTVLDADSRFLAGLPMAGAGGAVSRDVPVLHMAGDCDAIVDYSGIEQAAMATTDASLLTVSGAGHLAFSDLCTLDLQALHDTYLADRDDVSALFTEMLLGLGTDGCPGHVPPQPECGEAWLDLEISARILRHYATTFFDLHLVQRGDGGVDGTFPDATLTHYAR